MDAPPPLPAQDIVMKKPMEEITTNPTPKAANTPPSTCVERKPRPQKEKALNCPRCNSTNTKFCYYNNYSLTQPRYFCKACKRYWTEGGSLRSIPVGGRTRKNRRFHSSSSSSTATNIKLPHLVDQSSNINICTIPNPKLVLHHAQDLNLGFTSNPLHLPNNINIGPYDHKNTLFIDQTLDASNNSSHYISAVELLTGINASSRGVMAPFMPMQISYPNNSVYPVGFNSLQSDLRPSLSFGLQGVNETGGGRILFPLENLRSTTTTTTANATNTTTVASNADNDDHHRHQDHSSDQQNTRDHLHGDSTGYWTGNILGGAGSW